MNQLSDKALDTPLRLNPLPFLNTDLKSQLVIKLLSLPVDDKDTKRKVERLKRHGPYFTLRNLLLVLIKYFSHKSMIDQIQGYDVILTD